MRLLETLDGLTLDLARQCGTITHVERRVEECPLLEQSKAISLPRSDRRLPTRSKLLPRARSRPSLAH